MINSIKTKVGLLKKKSFTTHSNKRNLKMDDIELEIEAIIGCTEEYSGKKLVHEMKKYSKEAINMAARKMANYYKNQEYGI